MHFKINIKSRLFNQSAYNFFLQGIIMIIKFLYVPVAIHFLGLNNFGLTLILISIASYFSLIDFGLRSYITNRCTQIYYSGRKKLTDKIYINIFSSLVYFSIFFLILTIVTLFFFYFSNFQDGNKTKNIFLLSLFILILNSILVNIISFLAQYFRIIGKLIFSINIEALIIFLPFFNMCLIFFFLADDSHSIINLIIFSFIYLFSSLIILFFILKKISFYINLTNITNFNFTKNKLKRYLSKSIYFFVWSLNSVIVSNIIVQIIGLLLNAVDVARISVFKMLTNLVIIFIGTLTHPVLPDITRFYKDKDPRFLNKIITNYFLIAIFFIFSFSLFINYFVKDIFQIWVKEIIFDRSIFILLLYSSILTSFNQITANILLSLNINKVYSICLSILTFFFIILSFFMIKKYSLYGYSISILIYEAIHLVFIFFIIKNFITNSSAILYFYIFFISALIIFIVSKLFLLLILIIMLLYLFHSLKIFTLLKNNLLSIFNYR